MRKFIASLLFGLLCFLAVPSLGINLGPGETKERVSQTQPMITQTMPAELFALTSLEKIDPGSDSTMVATRMPLYLATPSHTRTRKADAKLHIDPGNCTKIIRTSFQTVTNS